MNSDKSTARINGGQSSSVTGSVEQAVKRESRVSWAHLSTNPPVSYRLTFSENAPSATGIYPPEDAVVGCFRMSSSQYLFLHIRYHEVATLGTLWKLSEQIIGSAPFLESNEEASEFVRQCFAELHLAAGMETAMKMFKVEDLPV